MSAGDGEEHAFETRTDQVDRRQPVEPCAEHADNGRGAYGRVVARDPDRRPFHLRTGKGTQGRRWLFVEAQCEARLAVLRHEPVKRAASDELALLDDGERGPEGADFTEDVGRVADRSAFGGMVGEHVDEAIATAQIEAGAGLVEQEQ